jgi:hypothetical protein
MHIGKPETSRYGDDVSTRFEVQTSNATTALWYSIDSKHAGLISDRADAAVVSLLIPAMSHGEDIHVDGAISEKLYYNLTGAYQKILQTVIPSLRLVKIHPQETRSDCRPASGVATGFSAGIDSYCVMMDHHYGNAPPQDFGSRTCYSTMSDRTAYGAKSFSRNGMPVSSLLQLALDFP